MASSAASAASDADEALPMLVGKVTAVAAFNRFFLRSTSKYGAATVIKRNQAAAFGALSGEVLSDQPIWREFAHFVYDAEADGDKKQGRNHRGIPPQDD